jgi:hypothetical protein
MTLGLNLSDTERLQRAVACVRMFIRDKRELNRLLRGENESSDDEIQLALMNALRDWNTTPPMLGGVTLANHPAKHLLLMAAAVEVVRGAMLWHSREHMPSSDGGTSADDHAKAGEYSAWLDRVQQDYERKKTDYKVAENLQAALGGMSCPSEYALYHGYGPNFVW